MAHPEVPKPDGLFLFVVTAMPRFFQRVDSTLQALRATWGRAPADASAGEDFSDTVPGRPTAAVVAKSLPTFPGGVTSVVGRKTAGARNPIRTLEMIRDYNPDASMAVWNFLRLVNPGVTIKALALPAKQETDQEGTDLLRLRVDGLLGTYGRDYGGGLDQIVNVLTLTLITQGAIAGELEIAEGLKDVLDWCPVDPRVVTFCTEKGTGHYVPTADWQGKSYVLPRNQFRYIPLDPAIGSPYGRGLMWPMLEATFFQVEVLRDLKMVAHTTGHPRMHLRVLEEVAESHIPVRLRGPGQEEARRAWMDAWLTHVADQYKVLKPDDAFITWNWIEVDSLDAGRSSYDLNSLVKVVEHQVISACKHLPILLGRMEGSGLAHGTVQWQIFAQSILALRNLVGTMCGWFGTQTLRLWGRQSVAVVEFPAIRTQDRVREAQAEALEVKTAIVMWKMGWVGNNELAERFVGHEPVGEPMVASLAAEEESEEAIEDESLEEGIGEGEEGSAEEAEERLFEFLMKMNGDNGNNRAFGLGQVGHESQYFDKLPVWQQDRIRRMADGVGVFATIRRGRVIDELEEEE